MGAPVAETPAAEEPLGDAPMEPLPALVGDWSGEFDLALPDGWTLTHCEGEAPMLCVVDGDRHVGFVELGVGCPGLTFRPTPATDTVVGGEPGVRAGFRLLDDEGVEVEHHVLYWTVADGAVFSVTAPVSVATIDLVELLSGQEAVDAARADGQIGPDQDLPNDFYLRDADLGTWDLRVAAATVAVYDCRMPASTSRPSHRRSSPASGSR